MEWVYLSPHLDDVALSCGGMVWEQKQAGERVSIWTICAGDPPGGDLSPFARSLHARWGTAHHSIAQRRWEDLDSCAILGADARHFSVLDCIYRQSETGDYLYDSEESLTGPVHPSDETIVEELRQDLIQSLSESSQLVCPLALGDHVDHHLTRSAAEKLDRPLWYYAEYPYVLNAKEWQAELLTHKWKSEDRKISEAGMQAWEEAVAAHRSQISTFWSDLKEMRLALRCYRQGEGGSSLWRPTFKA